MTRSISRALNEYQTARLRFVQTISDLASRTQNIQSLKTAGVLELIQPLLSDVIPSIQQLAVVAIGKLANYDEKIAHDIIKHDVITQILHNFEKQNKFFKKAALFLLRSLAKHSPEMSNVVIQSGGLQAMVICLEDFDPGVKEAAAWAIGYVARHNNDLARITVNAGVVPLLVLTLQEPELYLKQISASVLCDIAKHSHELSQVVADAGAIPFLTNAIDNPDVKLKRQAFLALGSLAKHSVSLAESVVEADIFPGVLIQMGHPDESVQKSAAVLTREICKHSLELAQLVVNTGGIGALIELICTSKTATRLPAIMALGYIAGHSAQMAMVAIGSKGAAQLASVLEQEMKHDNDSDDDDDDDDDDVLATTVWALGQMGKYSSEHAKAIATTNIFPTFIELYTSSKSSIDLKNKTRSTLKHILQKCTDIEAIEPLLQNAPVEILKYILGQFSKILPHDPRARRLFVTTGGLKKVQELQATATPPLSEYIDVINSCFPEEIVRYFTPGYPDTLLDIVEQYQPKRLPSTKIKTRQSSNASNSTVSLNPINE